MWRDFQQLVRRVTSKNKTVVECEYQRLKPVADTKQKDIKDHPNSKSGASLPDEKKIAIIDVATSPLDHRVSPTDLYFLFSEENTSDQVKKMKKMVNHRLIKEEQWDHDAVRLLDRIMSVPDGYKIISQFWENQSTFVTELEQWFIRHQSPLIHFRCWCTRCSNREKCDHWSIDWKSRQTDNQMVTYLDVHCHQCNTKRIHDYYKHKLNKPKHETQPPTTYDLITCEKCDQQLLVGGDINTIRFKDVSVYRKLTSVDRSCCVECNSTGIVPEFYPCKRCHMQGGVPGHECPSCKGHKIVWLCDRPCPKCRVWPSPPVVATVATTAPIPLLAAPPVL